MRLVDVARGAVTRGYPWSNRSSLPVLTSDWSQEGSALWKQSLMPVHNGTHSVQFRVAGQRKSRFAF